MLVSIVCPAYKEDDNLEQFTSELVDQSLKFPFDTEVIIVVDEPTERTNDILSQFDVAIIYNDRAEGKTKAFRDGFQRSKGDIIIMLETDLQYDPSEAVRFVDSINWGYDIASGHRLERADPSHRLWMSKLFNTVIRWIFNIKIYDNNSGFKAFRRHVLDDLFSDPKVDYYFGFHRYISVVATKKGYSLVNVPVSHYPRKYGSSYITFFGTGYRVFHDLILTLRNK